MAMNSRFSHIFEINDELKEQLEGNQLNHQQDLQMIIGSNALQRELEIEELKNISIGDLVPALHHNYQFVETPPYSTARGSSLVNEKDSSRTDGSELPQNEEEEYEDDYEPLEDEKKVSVQVTDAAAPPLPAPFSSPGLYVKHSDGESSESLQDLLEKDNHEIDISKAHSQTLFSFDHFGDFDPDERSDWGMIKHGTPVNEDPHHHSASPERSSQSAAVGGDVTSRSGHYVSDSDSVHDIDTTNGMNHTHGHNVHAIILNRSTSALTNPHDALYRNRSLHLSLSLSNSAHHKASNDRLHTGSAEDLLANFTSFDQNDNLPSAGITPSSVGVASLVDAADLRSTSSSRSFSASRENTPTSHTLSSQSRQSNSNSHGGGHQVRLQSNPRNPVVAKRSAAIKKTLTNISSRVQHASSNLHCHSSSPALASQSSGSSSTYFYSSLSVGNSESNSSTDAATTLQVQARRRRSTLTTLPIAVPEIGGDVMMDQTRKVSSYTLDSVSEVQSSNARDLESALRSLRDAQDGRRRVSLPISLSSSSRDSSVISNITQLPNAAGDKLPKTRSGSNWKLKANTVFPSNLQYSVDACDGSGNLSKIVTQRVPLGGKFSMSLSPKNRTAPAFDFADDGTAMHGKSTRETSGTKVDGGITIAQERISTGNATEADLSHISVSDLNVSQQHDDNSQAHGTDIGVEHSWETLNDPMLVHSPPPLHTQQHRQRFDYGALHINNDDSSVVSFLTAQSGPSPTSSLQHGKESTSSLNAIAHFHEKGSKQEMGLPSPVYHEMRMFACNTFAFSKVYLSQGDQCLSTPRTIDGEDTGGETDDTSMDLPSLP